MNENREISAESQHSFYFYPTLTQKYWADFHQVENIQKLAIEIIIAFHIFTLYRAISGAINAHICKVVVHLGFRGWEQRVKTVNFEVCKKTQN